MKADELMQLCGEVAENCVAYNLRRTMRVVSQRYEEQISIAGIHGTQFSLLVAIHLAGPVPITMLAKHLSLDRTTLTRNLQPLVRDELVTFVAGEDKRIRLVKLTSKGVKTLQKALPLWKKAQEDLMQKFGKANWQQTLADLRKMEAIER